MESTIRSNSSKTTGSDSVVSIEEYKKKKRSQRQTYLYIEQFYSHVVLPMSIQILALSSVNPFTGDKIYLCVNHKGSILCFNEGEEMNWKPISREEFEYYVENTKNDKE